MEPVICILLCQLKVRKEEMKEQFEWQKLELCSEWNWLVSEQHSFDIQMDKTKDKVGV